MDDDQPADYGLVMPFVVCGDQGGPYDGASFVAGYVAGALDELLRFVRPHGLTVERDVVPALVPQLDLLAMRYGYKLTVEAWDEHPDDWTLATFTPSGEPGD